MNKIGERLIKLEEKVTAQEETIFQLKEKGTAQEKTIFQ